MKTRLIILFLLFFTTLGMFSQDMVRQGMIGLSKEEVIRKVKEEHRKFRKDDSVVKQQFNYVKYVNRERTKTWIIFFDEKDICTVSKLVCDYSDFGETVKALDKEFRKKAELHWEYRQGRDLIQVEVEKKDWYYSVRETRK